MRTIQKRGSAPMKNIIFSLDLFFANYFLFLEFKGNLIVEE